MPLVQQICQTQMAIMLIKAGIRLWRKILQKIGVAGFEPATSGTPCRRSSQAKLHPGLLFDSLRSLHIIRRKFDDIFWLGCRFRLSPKCRGQIAVARV